MNGYFKGFVNTSGGVGVDIKIEKLMNRINKIVERNFNFDFVFVFDWFEFLKKTFRNGAKIGNQERTG